MAQGVPKGCSDEATVRRLWWGALETLQDEVLGSIDLTNALWLASPLPALYEPRLLDQLKGWVWAPEDLEMLNYPHSALLPPTRVGSGQSSNPSLAGRFVRLPLRKDDGHDPMLIIISPDIQVALAVQGEPGQRNLLMRSDQETFSDLLKILDQRLNNENSPQSKGLRHALADIGELRSDESFAKIFWPSLSSKLACVAPSLTIQTFSKESSKSDLVIQEDTGELSLLEALTHEVRTPLATIRTLIRSLLRMKDLPELVISRLREIDTECTEQIDRFGLIFNAAELQREQPATTRLASTDLGRMLEMLQPSWSKQLDRRGITLTLDITPDLPQVLSDPERLELMLGGLIDRNTRGLEPGSSLYLELRPAGHRLKLQIISKSKNNLNKDESRTGGNSDLGTVLSWNPRTGSLQLSEAATERLLESLGGWLTHRRNSGLTVFFPISEAKF